MTKIVLVIAMLLITGCASNRVYVKHCEELGDGVFECEKLD